MRHRNVSWRSFKCSNTLPSIILDLPPLKQFNKAHNSENSSDASTEISYSTVLENGLTNVGMLQCPEFSIETNITLEETIQSSSIDTKLSSACTDDSFYDDSCDEATIVESHVFDIGLTNPDKSIPITSPRIIGPDNDQPEPSALALDSRLFPNDLKSTIDITSKVNRKRRYSALSQPSQCSIPTNLQRVKPLKGTVSDDIKTDDWMSPYLYNMISGFSTFTEMKIGSKTTELNRDNFSPFSSYLLESISIASMNSKNQPNAWYNRTLILKSNFLFEYDSLSDTNIDPLAFAALSDAKIEKFDSETLKIHAKSTSNKTESYSNIFYIRIDTPENIDAWQSLLEYIAILSISDLFEFNSISDSKSEDSSLGHARFSTVKQAIRKGTGGSSYCALKIINRNEFARIVEEGNEKADTLYREASIQACLTCVANELKSTNDQPIVQLFSVFETSDHFVLEMELMSKNNLFSEITLSPEGKINETRAATIIRRLLESVELCQSMGIAHRDIKLSNICFCLDQRDIKLADFGMSKLIDINGKLSGRCGTPGYVAPEIFVAGSNGQYSMKVDLYSVGVVAYTILCGYEPFYGETDAELLTENKSGIFDFEPEDWCDISLEAQDLIECLMDPDPVTRINIKEALAHPWLSLKSDIDDDLSLTSTMSDEM